MNAKKIVVRITDIPPVTKLTVSAVGVTGG
jgi:hypothetical protein